MSASEKGEVSFSQPLSLPPAKLQPSVALGYGAGGGVHSWVGRGWSVSSGLTLTLTRPGRGGERAYLEGTYSDVVLVSGDGLSGMLRFDGAAWVWTSPSPGVVWATQYADGRFEVRAGNRTWVLEETLSGTWRTVTMEDRDGNLVEYTWTGSRLDDIFYGGAAGTSHHAWIRLQYGAASNPPTTWSAATGELETISERLDAVEVLTRSGVFWDEARSYGLTYRPGGEFLERIEELGEDGSSRTLAFFAYSEHDLSLNEDLMQLGEAPGVADTSRSFREELASDGTDVRVQQVQTGLYDLTFDGRPDTVLSSFYVDPQLTREDQRSYFHSQNLSPFYDCDGGPAELPVPDH